MGVCVAMPGGAWVFGANTTNDSHEFAPAAQRSDCRSLCPFVQAAKLGNEHAGYKLREIQWDIENEARKSRDDEEEEAEEL